ncbi:hypothetical protein [Halorhodospira halophila]|uniref:Uncharacterized protein n=1 Tax=Halorhodospira halophila (strain DSM 244 / SL1) TaxID=349124 RepID=A1WXK0_HALHL|nr:hypothetical protein [Halorhodospira halophila]ABM62412.1 hypothetical protein Hhal_1648 [Halorhodospira halophila SL1]MBK1729542.1 hypothetical protein [Halorhodospira halophila]
MKRNEEIIEALRTYTNRRIPLLWGSVLAILLVAHLVTAYLVEQFWSEHLAVTPWVAIAAVLIGISFFLYEKIGGKLRAAEFEFQRTALGYWDYERGYQQCEGIRQAALLGFLGTAILYCGFVFGQVCATADDASRKVLTDLAPGKQIELLSNPEQLTVLGIGAALIVGALIWIHRIREQIRSDLSA